jgi:hypothetical protein
MILDVLHAEHLQVVVVVGVGVVGVVGVGVDVDGVTIAARR